MDNCFAACGCDDKELLTKADFDRFTDKIENVLNDDKGKKRFRHFLFSSTMKDGRRKMDFLEHVERLLRHKDNADGISPRNYLREIDRLIDEAERIEELDFATMERLTIARDSENREEIIETLRVLKVEVAKALRGEYSAFRRHLLNVQQSK